MQKPCHNMTSSIISKKEKSKMETVKQILTVGKKAWPHPSLEERRWITIIIIATYLISSMVVVACMLLYW